MSLKRRSVRILCLLISGASWWSKGAAFHCLILTDLILCIQDIDCFYAQSEELRCPSLRGRPVGVTQKFLVVTSNYVARSMGASKMVSINEAKRKVPALVLVNGEDLTPYRADNKRILAVLRRFGTVEKHGLDEGAVDITAQVKARLRSALPALSFTGYVLGMGARSKTDEHHDNGTLCEFESTQLDCEDFPPEDASLLVGCQVVAEMRAAIEAETGFRCSCGIAQNKMLAKLASSLNKPGKQTCLLQGAVAEFLAPMSVRKLPGVGKQMQGALTELGVQTVADLLEVTFKQLSGRLGERIASFLFNACRGHDPSLVQDKGPPKSISVEDSFRNCKSMRHATDILRVLAPDLIRRLDEDREETGRRPKLFTVKWRVHGTNWNFLSASTPMPFELLAPSVAVEKRAFLMVDAGMKLLSRNLCEPFHLVVLNIGATNFVADSAVGSPAVGDIRSFLTGQGKSPEKALKVISKRDARAHRESFKAMAPASIPHTANPEEERNWGVELSAVSAEDEFRVSDSEEDEFDYLAQQIKVPEPRHSLKQGLNVNTFQSKKAQSSFEEQKSAQVKSIKSWNGASSSPSEAEMMSFGTVELYKTTPRQSMRADVKMRVLVGAHRNNPFETTVSSATQRMTAPEGTYSDPPTNCKAACDPVDSQRSVSTNLEQASSSRLNCDSNFADVLTSKRVFPFDKKENTIFSDRIGSLGEDDERRESAGEQIDPTGRWVCGECGDLVIQTDLAVQEHADYHFALSLDSQQKHPWSSRHGGGPAATRDSDSSRSTCPRKKSKTKDGTLDEFFRRF